MRIDLPQVGETVTEGVVVRWLKKPGDRVQPFEPLVEIETDKVTMEFPSPVAGVVGRLLAQEGQTVPVGGGLCEIETAEGAMVAPAPSAVPPALSPRPISTVGVLVEPTLPEGPTGVGEQALAEPAPPAAAKELRLSPLVRRLAAERGVTEADLAAIAGTGVNARVTKDDVLRYVERRTARPAVPATLGAEEVALPLTPVRRRIAEHMARSAQAPTAWTMVEADVSGLVALRQSLKEAFFEREGVDLTYLPFSVKAVVDSLQEHPRLNASWGGDKIILKKRVNIGVAVAAPEGLVVPVVHDAGLLGITALAKALRDVTARARTQKLTLQDVQGGTFTVNNTGAIGSIASQPLLNGAEAAILTTEAIVRRPVVAGDDIAIRSIMNLCLTFDHRVLDGHEAAAFIQSVKGRLEAMEPGMNIS